MSNDGAAGMTLRDWFAGQALAGMCKQEANIGEFMDVSCDAYEFANAMMRVRNHCSDCGRDLSETGGGTCQTCEVKP